MIVLTKGDLLDCTALAQCVLAVQLDLAPFVQPKKRRLPSRSVTAATGNNKSSNLEMIDVTSARGSDGGDVQNQDDADSTTTLPDLSRRRESALESGDMSAECNEDNGVMSDVSESDSDLSEDSDEESEGESERDLSDDSDTESDSEHSGGEYEDDEESNEEGISPAQAELMRMAAENPDEHYVPERVDVPHKHLVPVHVISSSTGAGIPDLWKRLCGIAREDSVVATSLADATHIVREHRLANSLRRKHVTQRASPQARTGRERNPHDLRPRDAHQRPILLCRNRRRVRDRMRDPIKVVETPLTGFTER